MGQKRTRCGRDVRFWWYILSCSVVANVRSQCLFVFSRFGGVERRTMQRSTLSSLRSFFKNSTPVQGRVVLQTIGLSNRSSPRSLPHQHGAAIRATPSRPKVFGPPRLVTTTTDLQATADGDGGADAGANFDDPIAVVQLENTDRRNALSCSMMHELDTIMDILERNFRGSCVVLTGTGDRAFCAGADLRSVESNLASNEAGTMMSE